MRYKLFVFLALSITASMLCIGWRAPYSSLHKHTQKRDGQKCFVVHCSYCCWSCSFIEKSSNKNHIFSHTFGYYCRIYFDKQLICMSNKLWRLHELTTNGTHTQNAYHIIYINIKCIVLRKKRFSSAMCCSSSFPLLVFFKWYFVGLLWFQPIKKD